MATGTLKVDSQKCEITVSWQIGNAKATFEKNKLEKLESPVFGQGQWKLVLRQHAARIRWIEIQVEATSDAAWRREGCWEVSYRLNQTATERLVVVKDPDDRRILDSRAPFFVARGFATKEDILKRIEQPDTLTIACSVNRTEITDSHRPRPLSSVASFLLDNEEHSDTVFTFSKTSTSPERHILAVKGLLIAQSSYFKDLSSFSTAEVPTIPFNKLGLSDDKSDDSDVLLDNPQVDEDDDDLQPFDEEDAAPVAVDAEQADEAKSPELPEFPQGFEFMVPKKEDGEGDDGGEFLREAKRRKTEEKTSPRLPTADLATEATTEGARSSSDRILHQIFVTDIGYRTFYAFLSYLHGCEIPFTALPSDYLVARQEAWAKEDAALRFAFEFPERGPWLRNKFDNLAGQYDWGDVLPASPHAMYRLAQKYEIPEVRLIAKDRIVRSLTIENVAYELFSPLSLEFEEIRNEIFSYFQTHWAETRTTFGWNTVISKLLAGALPNASALVRKVFDAFALSAPT